MEAGLMFERYTERARQVITFAQEEARELKHDYIGTEHILLGLFREEEGVAARSLDALGLTAEQIRDDVKRIVGVGEAGAAGQIPFTPRVKKVIDLSLREALSLGQNYIGTEHILLGLVRENEGAAARILLDFDADSEKIRNEVLRVLNGTRKASITEQNSAIVTVEMHRGHARALLELVGGRPHTEQWSHVVYQALLEAVKVDV